MKKFKDYATTPQTFVGFATIHPIRRTPFDVIEDGSDIGYATVNKKQKIFLPDSPDSALAPGSLKEHLNFTEPMKDSPESIFQKKKFDGKLSTSKSGADMMYHRYEADASNGPTADETDRPRDREYAHNHWPELKKIVDNVYHTNPISHEHAKTALNFYSEESAGFNRSLIQKHKKIPGIKTFPHVANDMEIDINSFDRKLSKVFHKDSGHEPTKDHSVVYSGVNGQVGKNLMNAKYGKVFTMPAYTSASVNPGTAIDFAHPVFSHVEHNGVTAPTQHVIAIHVPKGYMGARFIGHHSYEPTEWEVLMNRGMKLKLKSRRIMPAGPHPIRPHEIHSHTVIHEMEIDE